MEPAAKVALIVWLVLSRILEAARLFAMPDYGSERTVEPMHVVLSTGRRGPAWATVLRSGVLLRSSLSGLYVRCREGVDRCR